ncbi:MAG: TIGR03067 domain-containing protein [Planctomycetes bacterium]|nr:TIGR03067 domain-containing protein [Planctomycetota bacterium]
MSRVALFAVIAGMATTFTFSAQAANPKPEDDLASLQGNWKPLQCEFQGVPQMPADVMKQVTSVFDKNEYHLYFVDRSVMPPKVLRLALANISLDAAASPKTITFEFAQGPLKGKKLHGIYEIAGNQLKMCYGPEEKPKPTEFKAAATSGCFLETWARQVK